MGIYLNGTTAYTLDKSETAKPYFVDKTLMLEQLFPFINEWNNCICITRPRRFGKTVMANMIAAFFSKAINADDIFSKCRISANVDCRRYQNQYAVIHISFNDLPRRCNSYQEYIDRIEKRLIRDLRQEYQNLEISEDEAVCCFCAYQ